MKRISVLAALGLAFFVVSAARAERYVIMVNSTTFTFTPDQLNALAGDQIIWMWGPGPFPHTVTEDNGVFDSGIHTQPYTFRRIINRPGDYFYHCTQHGGPGGVGMSGVLRLGSRDFDEDDD